MTAAQDGRLRAAPVLVIVIRLEENPELTFVAESAEDEWRLFAWLDRRPDLMGPVRELAVYRNGAIEGPPGAKRRAA